MDVFNNDQPDPADETTNNAAPKEKVDIWVEKLMEIKRPDGTPKYETVEAALDAIKFQNDHIAKIERENAELAAKVTEVETLKETLERLGGAKMNEEKPKQETPANGGLSEEAAMELVRKALKAEKDTDTAVNNLKHVQDTLVAKYGKEKAQEAVMAKATELGVDAQQLKQLSATSPAMVLALFGEAKSSPTPNTGSINLGGYKPRQEELKRPEKSLLSGPSATDRNRKDLMAQIREKVYKEHGITG